jgi:hypothetical protein
MSDNECAPVDTSLNLEAADQKKGAALRTRKADIACSCEAHVAVLR